MDEDTSFEGVAEADRPLLLALLNLDQSFLLLGILLPWVTATSFDQQPEKDICPSQPQYWRDRLVATTPHSFAVSFLNFVRAQAQSIMAGQADSNAEHAEGINGRNAELDDGRPSAAMVLLQQNEIKQEPNSVFGSKFYPRTLIPNKGLPNRQMKSSKPSEHSYDDEFPALGSNWKPQKPGESQKKPTRRVNPTPISNPVVDSAFVLAKVEHTKPSRGHDKSKMRIPSSGSFKVDMDALMQRFEKKHKKKQKDACEKCGQERASELLPKEELLSSRAAVDSSIENKLDDDGHGRYIISAEVDCCDRNMLHASSAPTQVRKPSSAKLKAVAKVHATLLNAKLVPSLLGELGFLFQLLNLEGDMCIREATTQITKKLTDGMVTDDCGRECEVDKRLFTRKDDCCIYACMVMEQLERILNSVGEHLLSVLIEHPAIVRHAPNLLSRIRGLLACHQAASMHSFKAYKCTDREGGNSQELHVSSVEGSRREELLSMPFCLPFEASRDSRNNYKTRESQKIYNNLELCRDQFYAIVREAGSVHNAFNFATYTFESDLHTRLHDSIKGLMKLLLLENYPWFTGHAGERWNK